MGDPEPPPALSLSRGRVLVWGGAAARALRERHRVSGVLVGVPPRRRRPRDPPGPPQRLPLQLLPEEARLLAETRAATLRGPPALEEPPEATEGQQPDPPGPTASPPPPPAWRGRPSPQGAHERRFRVFRDLWGRGLHLTAGGKFGGDFLVYPGPPERFHAAAVALVPPPGAALPLPALVAAARLGTHVRKTLLLCHAPPGRDPAYTSVTWCRRL